MLISVIIPVYNEEERIGKCLDCIKKQTQKPNEIIVIDNNSTDKSVIIAQKYGVRIVREKTQGISSARNAGFNSARGDIILRCDADTLTPPTWIECVHKNFIKHTIDALSGPVIFYDLPVFLSYPIYFYFFFLKFFLRGNETLIGPNMAITRTMWNKVRDEVCTDDKNIHEDIDLSMHIVRHGGKIYRDNKNTVFSCGRRISKTPHVFFINYPYRFIKTAWRHRQWL